MNSSPGRLLPSLFAADSRPVAAIFRSPVFNRSETFIAGQAAGLVRYQPIVLGLQEKGHVPEALEGRVLLARRSQSLLLKLLGDARGLAAEIACLGPCLVHAHFATDGLLALPLARRLGVPLLTSLRGYDVFRSPDHLLRSGRLSWMRYALWRRRLMNGGNLFLAVSDALREHAIAAGYPRERTLTHYNGVDLDRFHPAGTGDRNMILHVGRLVEKKGTAVLLGAFAGVVARHPQARLVIVGEGPCRPALERLSDELNLTGAVRFAGFLPAAQVAELMRQATALAAPSLCAADGDAEGLPNAIVEAAASGLPVVATHHSGNCEAIEDARTGFLVPEHAVEPLASRLDELLTSADLRREFGLAARRLAERKFDMARQMARLESLYDRAVAGEFTSTSAIATR